MEKLFKAGQAYFVTGLIMRGSVSLSIVITAIGVAAGDGGTFSIGWTPAV